MTILFLSIEFNYCCGISQSIYSLARELKQRGHIVILGVPGGSMVDDFKELGMDYVYVPILPNNKKITDVWRGISIIRKIVREKSVDIIHSHNRLADMFSLIANLMLNKPTVATAHALVSGSRVFSFRTDKVVAVSRAIEKMLKEDFKIKADRIHVIKNIPRRLNIPAPQAVENFRRKISNSKNDFIVAGIGRLHHEKGFDVLVEAIKRSPNLNIKTILVGKGHEKKWLQDYVDKHKLNVIFIDEVKEVELVYSIADVIVVPSRQESAGLVAIEAGFFRRLVIGSDVGGLPETIKDKVTGILVKPGDAKQLREALETIVIEKNVVQEMGDNLYDYITNEYDAAHIADNMESVYHNLTLKKWNQ